MIMPISALKRIFWETLVIFIYLTSTMQQSLKKILTAHPNTKASVSFGQNQTEITHLAQDQFCKFILK